MAPTFILFVVTLVVMSGISNADIFDDYDVVTDKSTTKADMGYIPKCGEGKIKNVKCVHYTRCDPHTDTIIPESSYSGGSTIDILGNRRKENYCDKTLDKCCKIPSDGQSSTTPGEVTVNPRPPKPTRPNKCGMRYPDGLDFKISSLSNEANFAEFPWMVEIIKTEVDNLSATTPGVCGGSLITPTAVLTAAHCVYKYSSEKIKVRAGEWDTQTNDERYPFQERNIAHIIIHPEFIGRNLFNDIALLIVNKPFQRADNLGTICLPSQGQFIDSKNCFATGWGTDQFGSKNQLQVILKKLELPIVDLSRCQNLLRNTKLGPYFKLHHSFICAGADGKDTCTGDGGAPLVCPDPNNPKRYLQAGIVSWGVNCGDKNVPGVYVDVSVFREWVDLQMEKLNINTRPYNL